MTGAEQAKSMKLAMEAAAWFFDNTLDVFLIVRDGVVERASPSWTNFLGWPEEEAIGRPFWDFVHPRDLDIVKAGVLEAEQTGQAIYEHRVKTKDGDWRWVKVRIKVAGDGAGIVVMQDISRERRRLQEAAEAGSAYKLLSTASGVRLWRYHPQTDEYEVDPDFSTPFLDTAPERRHRAAPMFGALHREDGPAVEDAWRASVRTGKLAMIEYRVRLRSGEWRSMRGAFMGVRQLPSGSWELVGVTQDLTELMDERDRAVRGEAAANQASTAKAQFLANISHELRTPMNGVLGTLFLLKNAGSEADRLRLADEAITAGADLSRLLGDIVDFADADAGRVRIEAEPVDMAAFVRQLCLPYRERASEAMLGFVIETAAADGEAQIDPVRLRQILNCLLSNAFKFTEAGGVTLRAQFDGEGPQRRLVFEVSDTGVGIAHNQQDSLFSAFHQADGSATRRFGGAGLGLARAKKLAELMGGTITFESIPGVGSTFKVSLAAPPCAESDRAEAILGGLDVLLVEDNPTNRLVASQLLHSLGAAVTQAENGEEGLRAAEHRVFDLIFMDIQMPVMDGVEAARRIRALPGPSGQTPIIALTANVLEHQVKAYEECGMNGVVGKPISPAALVAELVRMAGGQEAAANAA